MEGLLSWLKLNGKERVLIEEQKGLRDVLPSVYLVGFRRAFSRAVTILRSHCAALLPGLMSSALSRAERAEI